MTTELTTNLPVVHIKDGEVFANSRDVAEFFGKRHDNVLQAVTNLDCSPHFTALNFKVSAYIDPTGRTIRSVDMTKDGFSFLVMGFTGAAAARFCIRARLRDKVRWPRVSPWSPRAASTS